MKGAIQMKHKCSQCGKTYNADPTKYDGKVFCPFCGFYFDGSGYTTLRLTSKPTLKDLLWVIIPLAIAISFLKTGFFIYPNNGYLLYILIGIVFALGAIFGISLNISFWKDYRLALKDNRAFQKHCAKQYAEMNKRLEEMERTNKEREREKEALELDRLSKLPVCPICNSKASVKRISTLDRSVSATVWGLGSSKIGKQYECTHCKHYF